MFKDRRIGKFILSTEIIDNRPDLVLNIMGRCIVVKVEFSFMDDHLEYTAISEHFKEIPVGGCIPVYVWTVDDNGKATAR